MVAILVNFSGGITTMFWLSFWPWSAPGGHDKVSAGMLVFPGTYWIS